VKKAYWIAGLSLYALLAYGMTKMSQIQLVNSTIDNTPIGATTPSTINATAVTASSVNSSSYLVGGVPLAAANLSNGTSGTGAICLVSGSACTPAVIVGNKGAVSCSPSGGSYSTCTDTITWRTGTFPDTNYSAVCSLQSPITSGDSGSASLLVFPHAATSTTTLTVTVQDNSSDSTTTANDIVCIGQEL
jgi:hypothetical protein